MMRRCVCIGLVLALAPTSTFAQSLKGSIDRAAALEVAQQQTQQAAQAQQKTSNPIPPKFLWSGVGMLAAGGVFLGLGAAEDEDTETCVTTPEDSRCVSHRTAYFTTGALLAAGGATMLIIGMNKRSSPQITFRPGGVVVKQSVPIDLGIGRLIRR